MKPSIHARAGLMRLFVAVELDEATRQNLATEQARLLQTVAGVKWVSPAMIHLTLVFLGDVFSEQVPEITRVLDTEASATAPFAIEVTGLGTFGRSLCPRVVWVGLRQGAAEVTALQGRIAQELRALNLSLVSRPFHPHFTLGRVKSPREAEGLDAALTRSADTVFGVVKVERVLLMRSELLPHGPIHAVQHESALAPPLSRSGQL